MILKPSSGIHTFVYYLGKPMLNQCKVFWLMFKFVAYRSLTLQTNNFIFCEILVLFGRFWWKDYISELCILELMISNSLTAFGLARYLCATSLTIFSLALSSFFFLLLSSVCVLISTLNFLQFSHFVDLKVLCC